MMKVILSLKMIVVKLPPGILSVETVDPDGHYVVFVRRGEVRS